MDPADALLLTLSYYNQTLDKLNKHINKRHKLKYSCEDGIVMPIYENTIYVFISRFDISESLYHFVFRKFHAMIFIVYDFGLRLFYIRNIIIKDIKGCIIAYILFKTTEIIGHLSADQGIVFEKIIFYRHKIKSALMTPDFLSEYPVKLYYNTRPRTAEAYYPLIVGAMRNFLEKYYAPGGVGYHKAMLHFNSHNYK